MYYIKISSGLSYNIKFNILNNPFSSQAAQSAQAAESAQDAQAFVFKI